MVTEGVLWDTSVSLEGAGGGTGLFEVVDSWARSMARLAARQRQLHSRAAAITDTTRILLQSRFTAPPSSRFPRMAARMSHHSTRFEEGNSPHMVLRSSFPACPRQPNECVSIGNVAPPPGKLR